ncbi:phosphotransferase [Paenibacillus rhizovicinus]|uniref:Phosphotransferase n=2 Tax=Paenibacillus rhizovicinus TaxID=2704463 RepID=A0A6C0PCV1_9BACL|nr:phosphotransferase [Paenibacillus rhizovicinus]
METFGSGYRPAGISRVFGGAQKVIYDVAFANGFHCLLYVWDLNMNFFKEDILDTEGPAWNSYGADLFAMNHAFLTGNGIPTPALHALNRDQERYPFDYAFVEYMKGPKLEAYLFGSGTELATNAGAGSSVRTEGLMEQFADVLKRMHGIRSRSYGKADHRDDQLVPCHRQQLANAEKQLRFAAQHIHAVAEHEERLLRKLHELEHRIMPRQDYGFIHGELGPDHVLVKGDADLYLIDIEGASFYDVEHEHSFLHLRFGEHYERLRDDSLDPARLAFYQLHQYLSLTAGGLKLLQRGFHDRALAQGILDSNLRRALQFKGSS